MSIEWTIAILLCSIALGLVFFLFCVALFPKWNLLDFPERYGLHRAALPYPAGIAIVFAFLLGVIFLLPFDILQNMEKIMTVLFGLLVITIVSFIDDRTPLSALLRLSVQCLVAFFLVFQGIHIEFLTNPLSPNAFHLPFWLAAFITIIWILGCMNTLNWLDGVPNLAVTNGMISSAVVGFLALSPSVNQLEIAALAFCLSGVLLPFVLGNLTKTRYILGDSGSMTIGFLLAVFSVFSGGKMATMLISMSIPIFDGLFVFVMRLAQKKSPFQGKDNLHLHDQLTLRHWKSWHILLLYVVVSLALGISVLFLETTGKMILITAFGTIFFIGRLTMEYKK